MAAEITIKPGTLCAITGATGGLGRVLAKRFAAAGARLILLGREEEALRALSSEVGAEAIVADLAATEDVARAGETLRRLKPQVLINNAAVMGPIGRLWDIDIDDWTASFGVNLFAPVTLAQAVLSGMQRARRGKIINLSGGGATGPRPSVTAYACAKTALVRFTECLAHEVKGEGIDVNSVAPGIMPTKMLSAIMAAGPDKAVAGEITTAQATLDRENEASTTRAADLCLFLASPASDGISGRLVSAKWDPWHAFGEHIHEIAAGDLYTLRRIVPRDRDLDWEEGT